MMAPPQLSPAPKPAHAITSPGLTLPDLTASESARGIDAALVLPYSSKLAITLSMGMPRREATASIMRMFAWWRTSQSMSSTLRPEDSSAAPSTLGTLLHANLYTSLPFIAMDPYDPLDTWPAVSERYLSSPSYDKLSSQRPLPSLCMSKPRRPQPVPSGLASSLWLMTTAPAPSPKRMHVLRSSQSTQRESASAPMTSTFVYAPVCTNCDAVTRPNRKPEHAAVKSKPTADVAPMAAATWAASPKRSSGLEVARMTRSTSSAATPALSRASLALAMERSEMAAPWAKRWRLRMPVRLLIHSSDVSTKLSRSLLLTTASGAADPMPAMRTAKLERPGTAADAATLERDRCDARKGVPAW
mmetsp:Transcript_13503/g.36060  ORF Transcript_13503/g.36060 Transcript_13503/m.36060 type:complete len:359 (-) Transcript_13503:100-1176(-)